MKREKELRFILAHGEAWEVTAPQSIDDVVRKILEENGTLNAGKDTTGKLELHYSTGNDNKKCIITLLNQVLPKVNGHEMINGEKQVDKSIIVDGDREEVRVAMGDMINSRF